MENKGIQARALENKEILPRALENKELLARALESKEILAGSDDGKVNFFDLVRGTKVKDLSVSSDVVHSLSYHPSGKKEEFTCASKDKIYVFQGVENGDEETAKILQPNIFPHHRIKF